MNPINQTYIRQAVDYEGNPIHPEPEKTGFKAEVIKIGKFIDSENQRSVLDGAASVVSAVRGFTNDPNEGLSTFTESLSGALEVLSVFSVLNHIAWWFCEEAKRWQETAMMAFAAASRVMKSLMFLQDMKLLELGKLALNIGRGIPIISIVINGLGFLSSGFGLWNSIQELLENRKKQKDHQTKLDTWTNLQKEFNSQFDLRSKDTLSLSLLVDKYARDIFKGTNIEHLDDAEKLTVIKQRFAHEVEKYQAIVKHDNVETRKAWLGVADDICALVVLILTMIGFCTGVGALAATGALILSLGIFTAGLAVYKCYYSSSNNKDKVLWVPAMPSIPEAVKEKITIPEVVKEQIAA